MLRPVGKLMLRSTAKVLLSGLQSALLPGLLPGLLCALLTVLLSCSSTKNSLGKRSSAKKVLSGGPASAVSGNGLSTETVQKLNAGVFEVVIPRYEDKHTKTSKPLPFEKLPFQERNSKVVGIGTAFSVEKGKYISAAHVFSLETKKWNRNFFLRDSKGGVSKVGQILRYDEARDLIEFQLEKTPNYHAILESKLEVNIGEGIFTVGNAFGEGISIRGGQISSLTPEERNGQWKYIRYSAPASPGNSGGPLVTQRGQVVGIVVMKNTSENLNYAMPLKEVLGLSEKKIVYAEKGVEYKTDELSVKKDFQLEIQLPVSLTDLANKYSAAKLALVKNLYADYTKKYQASLFPKDPKLQAFLRDQDTGLHFRELHFTAKEGWHFHNFPAKTIALDKNLSLSDPLAGPLTGQLSGQVTVQKPRDLTYYYFVNKPKQGTLTGFLEDSENILAGLLKGVGWFIEFAGEKIPVTSYGPAHQRTIERDSLGRPWITQLWRNATDDTLILNECLAVPGGAACMFSYTYAAAEGILEVIPRTEKRDLMIFTPSGTVAQWQEFLKLDKKYRWDIYQNTHFEIKNSNLILNAGNLSLQSKLPDLNEKTLIFSFAHYVPKQPSKLMTAGWMLLDQNQSAYIFHKVYEPASDADAKTKDAWKQLVDRKEPFDGTAKIDQGETLVLHSLSDKSSRAPASAKKPAEHYMLLCKGNKDAKAKHLKSNCDSLKKTIRFRD